MSANPVPVEELLARIRACISTTPSNAVVSLTVNVEDTGETTIFRVTVHPDGSVVSLSTALCVSSHSEPAPLQDAVTMEQRHENCGQAVEAMDVEHDDAATPTNDGTASNIEPSQRDPASLQHINGQGGQAMEALKMELNEAEADAPSPTDAMTPNSLKQDVPSSDGVSDDSEDGNAPSYSSPVTQSSQNGDNIRRSGRQQQQTNRLTYTTTTPARKGGSHVGSQQHAGRRKRTEDTTDESSSSGEESDGVFSSSSSILSSPHQLRKQRKIRRIVHSVADDLDQEIDVLVTKLQEAYTKRTSSVDLEQTSASSVTQLGRDILASQSVDGSTGLDYQQYASKLDQLITTSTATRMFGYYLKGALAAKLKQRAKKNYVRLARSILGLKSSADIAACPAFYDFIQWHCPIIAGGVIDVQVWLQEPIFLADIGWSEWRRYMGKAHRPIIDRAMEIFKASLEPTQDWMQRELVEVYDDDHLGQGVRAKCDIPLPSGQDRRLSRDTIVADLGIFVEAQQLTAWSGQQPQEPTTEGIDSYWYSFEWNGGKRVLDAERLWIGKINHLPTPLCNVKLQNNGKLVQVKAIGAGEALTFDYGVHYWVHRVTGMRWNEWMSTGTVQCRKGCADLFHRMHDTVSDYTAILAERWAEQFAAARTEVQREQVMADLWQQVAPNEEEDVLATRQE